jgi:hypothetical protein
LATPFVQGRLRREPFSITVETRCEHCSEPLTLEIDTDMNVRVAQPGATPMVFIPDVPLFNVEAPSIVDDF